jgi:hypothetical protein
MKVLALLPGAVVKAAPAQHPNATFFVDDAVSLLKPPPAIRTLVMEFPPPLPTQTQPI